MTFSQNILKHLKNIQKFVFSTTQRPIGRFPPVDGLTIVANEAG